MRARWRPSLPHIAWIIGAWVAIAACDLPTFEGPQLQSPPRGFLMVEGSYPLRQLVSGHEPVFRRAWVESGLDVSTIYIDGYRAVLGYEDAVAARDESARYALDPDTRVGDVEPFTVDGRSGWGWEERVETPSRGLVWVAYRALVPYDTITYTIEFSSGNPTFKRTAPDTLKAVIATFGIGRTTYDLPLIALGAGLLLFALAVVRSKRQQRAARLRSINLVKIPKKEAKDGEPATRAPAQLASRAPAQPPALGATPAASVRQTAESVAPRGQPPSTAPTKK